jgi:hypothetical protein
MKSNYTHIVLLIDRSGSMSSIKYDMEGGIKAFLDNQKNEDGECTVTVAQFDTLYETLFNRKPLNEVEEVKIEPRGGTALIDSMVRLINEVGIDLAEMDESERPEKILFVTITDGEENSSRHYSNEELKKKIEEQENIYKWNFTYIGANQDSFQSASQVGIKSFKAMNYSTSKKGIDKMFSKLSAATSRYRKVTSNNLSSDSFAYTDEEQKDI